MKALELPPVDPEVKQYQRVKLTLRLTALLLEVGWLVTLAFWLGPQLPPLLEGVGGSCPWLQLLVTAGLLAAGGEALTLPFRFYSSHVLEHRYQLSNQTFLQWLRRLLLGYFVGLAIGIPLLLGLYALLWYSGDWWWVWASAGWLVVTLVLGRLMPLLILPLFYKVTPLEDPDLRERLERIAAGTGLTLEGVYRLHLSAETKKANAALAGLGRARRVLLGDTLLAEFTPEEIEVVFAHEVGHHVHRHLSKMIVWNLATTVVGFLLIDTLLRGTAPLLGYTSFTAPAALPLLLLILMLLGLTLTPLENAVSRYFERQCDRYALDRTGLKEAYCSAFIKLARINKSDPDPHPVVVWLFYDHPPIRARLRLAEEPG